MVGCCWFWCRCSWFCCVVELGYLFFEFGSVLLFVVGYWWRWFSYCYRLCCWDVWVLGIWGVCCVLLLFGWVGFIWISWCWWFLCVVRWFVCIIVGRWCCWCGWVGWCWFFWVVVWVWRCLVGFILVCLSVVVFDYVEVDWFGVSVVYDY